MSVDAAKKENLFLQGSGAVEEPLAEGLEAAFEREKRKRPALQGEIKKTKMRVRLQKPAASVFSEATMFSEKDEPEEKRAKK
jgi:aspartate aminotransferase-like enzyme